MPRVNLWVTTRFHLAAIQSRGQKVSHTNCHYPATKMYQFGISNAYQLICNSPSLPSKLLNNYKTFIKSQSSKFMYMNLDECNLKIWNSIVDKCTSRNEDALQRTNDLSEFGADLGVFVPTLTQKCGKPLRTRLRNWRPQILKHRKPTQCQPIFVASTMFDINTTQNDRCLYIIQAQQC